jgi:type II secretory pathway pseudopilin PulG
MLSRSAHGMILLEVIIALSIFAAVAFSLIMALDAATDAATDRNQIDAATVGLENQMAQIVSTRITPVRRDLPNDNSGITYRLEIGPEPLQDDAQRSFVGFYRVTLKARWKAGSRDESRELSELVYQP